MLALPADIYAWLITIDVLDDSTYDVNRAKYNKLNYPRYPQLPASVANFSFNENGTVSLSSDINKTILTGYFFPDLLTKFNILMNTLYGNIYKFDESLTQIVNDELPQIKLHNWDILLESLKNYYGIIFDNDFKTLLIAGDSSTFLELFQKWYSFYLELQERIDKEVKTHGMKENTVTRELELPVFDNDKTKELPKVRFNEDVVDWDSIISGHNEIKPWNQTRSVLEFIIVALCRSMSLSAKQSAALLSDNKKYWTHILIKGLSKKNYRPVKQFYQEVLGNVDYFVQWIQINSIAYPNQISKNIDWSWETFKPGILSKNIDIVYISGRLLSKLALELIECNLISAAWDWFVSPSGGLESCILCWKRFDTAVEVVVTLINNFARFHIYELFAVYLKNFLQNDGVYFTFLSDIIEKFSRLSNFNTEFSKNNWKQFFMEYIIEVSRSPNMNERMKSGILLSEIWIHFSVYIETEMENHQFLSILKSWCKDQSRLVQYTAIAQLFRIWLAFSSERNSFVPVIYKSLIFTFIEYHSDLYLRELMISNFEYVFKLVWSIPIGILVEPYMKQIKISWGISYFVNINDISVLTTIARHPRFNVKEAVQAWDIIGKVYFDVGEDINNLILTNANSNWNNLHISVNNKNSLMNEEVMQTNKYRGIYFYKILKSCFTMILSRYLMHEIGVEFCFKYVKMWLETFCRLDKMWSDKIYWNALVLNVNPEDNKDKLIFEEDLIFNENEVNKEINFRSWSKIVIVQMVMDILKINNTFINSVIKNLLIVAELRHYKIYSFHNIGISKMLSHFGNPHDIVYYYNINKDELDLDTEFEISVELIYDKLPDYRASLMENMNVKNDDDTGMKSNTTYNNKTINKDGISKRTDWKSSKWTSKTNTKIQSVMNLPPSQVKHWKSLKESLIIHNKTKMKKGEDYVFFHEKLNDYKRRTKSEDRKFWKLNNNILLHDLNFEEDRDLIKWKKFLKDYSNFFKEVFMNYCGSIYHPIKGKMFNAIKEIADTISPSEIIKMFTEHNIAGKEISKEDWWVILSLMNAKIFKKPNLRAGISFDEFIEDFIQISYYAFCRPPYVYRHFTISDYAEEMVKWFSKEFPENTKYLHPDQLWNADENELCNYVNTMLEKTNFVKIPHGYNKYLATEIRYTYKVPDNMYWVLGEGKKICYEWVDEIINNIVNYHVLEGFASVKEIYKVRPQHPKKVYPRMVQRHLFEEEKFKVWKDRNKKVPIIMGRKGNKKDIEGKESEYDWASNKDLVSNLGSERSKSVKDNQLFFKGKKK